MEPRGTREKKSRHDISLFPFIYHLCIHIFIIIYTFFAATFIVLLYQLASIHVYAKVISVRVRNEIFRSGFLGAVVQLTQVLGNDVIEALTSDVIKTLAQADITK